MAEKQLLAKHMNLRPFNAKIKHSQPKQGFGLQRRGRILSHKRLKALGLRYVYGAIIRDKDPVPNPRHRPENQLFKLRKILRAAIDFLVWRIGLPLGKGGYRNGDQNNQAQISYKTA